MIEGLDGKTPKIAPSAFISKMACVIGDVEIGENSSVWPGAVVRGDVGSIVIGNNVLIEDNVVIHGNVNIGNDVTVGHCAVVEGLKIGDNVLIGNGAVVLRDVEIGNKCIIGANAMVREGTKIPELSFVVGVPATIKGELTPQQEHTLEYFRYPPELVEKHKREGTL